MARRRENPFPPGSSPRPITIPGVRSVTIEIRKGGYKDDPDGPATMTLDRFWTSERCDNKGCSGGAIHFGSEILSQIGERARIKGVVRCVGSEAAGSCHYWVAWSGTAEYENGLTDQ